MKQPSFWEKDTFDTTFDLIVIGAGIVGLSSALFYKKRQPEARVIVLDKGSIPEGASTRNAGFACVGSITEHMADMAKASDEDIKKRIQRRYRGLQLLRKTLGDDIISYENCGGYELFTSSAAINEASDYISLFNRWMEELVGEREVYRREKLNGYAMIHNRLEGALHPGRMMRALINQVQSTGILIYWNTNVRKLRECGEVILNRHTLFHAKQVLVASNGFTKHLLPDLMIEPARGFVMVSEPWSEMPWKGTFHYDRGYIYFRNVGTRLLLGGARNVAVDEEMQDQFGINAKIRDHLCGFANEILKMPATLSFEHEWSGIMGFTATKTPVLERLSNWCVVAAGLSGMGIAIGMEVAKEAVRLVSRNEQVLSLK